MNDSQKAKINFTTYLFGSTNGRYIQYPQDYTQEIFEDVFNKSIPTMQSFIAVHRKNNMMYYTYVRRRANNYINEIMNINSSNVKVSYIGICIALNSVMFKKISPLFKMFEGLIEKLVLEGDVFSVCERTIVIADEPAEIINRKLYIARDIVNKAIKEENELYTELPCVSYGVESQEIQKFNILLDKEEIISDASHKYSLSFVYKNDIIESPLLIQAINKATIIEESNKKRQNKINRISNILYALFLFLSFLLCFLISYSILSPKKEAYNIEYNKLKSSIKNYERVIADKDREIKNNKENIHLTERKILNSIKNNVEKINKISPQVPIIILSLDGVTSNDTLTISFVANTLSENKEEVPLAINLWDSEGEPLRGKKSPNGYTHIEKIKLTEENKYKIILTHDNTGVYHYPGTTQIEITYNGILLF